MWCHSSEICLGRACQGNKLGACQYMRLRTQESAWRAALGLRLPTRDEAVLFNRRLGVWASGPRQPSLHGSGPIRLRASREAFGQTPGAEGPSLNGGACRPAREGDQLGGAVQ